MMSRAGTAPRGVRTGMVTKKHLGASHQSQASDGAKKTHMKVIVRVRPQNEREQESSERCIVKTVDDMMLVFDPKEEDQPFFFHGVQQNRRDMLKKQHKEMEFIFDRVFGGAATNRDVFEGSTKEIVSQLLRGFNSSVFVYGATGAGKTFTMLGNEVNPGITYLTVVELYNQMTALAHERTFDLWVSYLEVYNENVHDLLNKSKPLNLVESIQKGVSVSGLKHKVIKNADELLDLLAQGNQNRTQHPTDANAESSRSHAVFQVYINMKNRLTNEVKQVKLSMIDLAGSERAAASGCRGARFKEGANINRSLLSLGNCINKLADGSKHIPFRDSKLTRLLKDSLGGNCHTVMIANVSPAPTSYEDTYNTLKYALRAKKIKSTVTNNVVSIQLHVEQYVVQVEELQRELELTKKQLKESQDAAAAFVANNVDMNALTPQQLETLQEWRDQLNQCFLEKTKLHREIMRLESRMKSVKYRLNVKKKTGIRLSLYHLFEDATLERAFGRIYGSLHQFQAQVKTFQQKIAENWGKDLENSQRIDELLKRIEDDGLTKKLEKDLTVQMLQLRDAEADMELVHLQNLNVVQQAQLESQENIIAEMSKFISTSYTILQGADRVTEPIQQDYERIRRLLEGIKIVHWGRVHTTDVEAPATKESPLQIPPTEMADIMELAFSKLNRHTKGDTNNISQLNASSTDVPYLKPRFSEEFPTKAEYVRIMMALTERNTGSAVLSEPSDDVHSDFEDADALDLSETESPRAVSPTSVATVEHEPGTVEQSSLNLPRKRMMNETFVSGSPECKSPKYEVPRLDGTSTVICNVRTEPGQNSASSAMDETFCVNSGARSSSSGANSSPAVPINNASFTISPSDCSPQDYAFKMPAPSKTGTNSVLSGKTIASSSTSQLSQMKKSNIPDSLTKKSTNKLIVPVKMTRSNSPMLKKPALNLEKKTNVATKQTNSLKRTATPAKQIADQENKLKATFEFGVNLGRVVPSVPKAPRFVTEALTRSTSRPPLTPLQAVQVKSRTPALFKTDFYKSAGKTPGNRNLKPIDRQKKNVLPKLQYNSSEESPLGKKK